MERALENGGGADSDSVASVDSVTSRIRRPPRPQPLAGNNGTSESVSSGTAASSAGTTVGGQSRADSGTSEVSLLLVESSTQVCGGVIGDRENGIFCTRPVEECKIQSHVTKFDVPFPFWYIQKPGRRKCAFIEPRCKDEDVNPEPVRDDFLVSTRSVGLWRGVFTGIAESVGVEDATRDRAAGLAEGNLEVDVELGSSDGTVSELGTPSALMVKAANELTYGTPLMSPFVGRVARSVRGSGANVSEIHRLEDIHYTGEAPGTTEWDKSLFIIVEGWNTVDTNFSTLKLMAKDLVNAQDALKDGVSQDLRIVQGKVQLLDSKIHLLKERIGYDDAASEGGIKTVWTALAELLESKSAVQIKVEDLYKKYEDSKQWFTMMSDGLSRVKTDVVDIQKLVANRSVILQELEEAKTAVGKLKSDMDGFQKAYEVDLKAVDNFFGDHLARIIKLEDSNASPSSIRFPRTMGLNNSGAGYVTAADHLALEERLVAVERELRDLRAERRTFQEMLPQLQAMLANSRSNWDGQSQGAGHRRSSARDASYAERQRAHAWEGGYGDLPALQARTRDSSGGNAGGSGGDRGGSGGSDEDRIPSDIIEHLLADMEYVKARIVTLQNPGHGAPIEIEGFKFCSVEDCKAFIRRYKVDVGYFTDACSATKLMGGKNLTGKEKADELYAAKRTSTTIKLNDLSASMDGAKPPKFFAIGGSGACEELNKGFAAIPKHEHWEGTGMDGKRNSLSSELENFLRGIEGVLRGTDNGVMLARALIRRVRAFWTSFVHFIDQGFRKLRHTAHFSEEASWNLMGRYAGAYFESMGIYRASASQLTNPESLDDQATLMWAVLQCHRVTQEFIDVEWEGHPEIVRQTSLFMLTERVDPGALAALTTTVQRLDAQVETLDKRTNDMKRKVDNTTNDLVQLKKEAKKKENKKDS